MNHSNETGLRASESGLREREITKFATKIIYHAKPKQFKNARKI
jgi:hypothetical protein